jgi:hypothetical protein
MGKTNEDYSWIYRGDLDFETLVGKTINKIEVEDDRVNLFTDCGRYTMISFEQWCGNDVEVYLDNDEEDNLDVILNSPILLAEESEGSVDGYDYTFYKLSTAIDSITLRFYGRSNGYYSESVELYKS